MANETGNTIPKHWQVKKLGEVCDVLDNLRKPINSAERQVRIAGKSQSELFPYYGATGQVGWIDSFLTNGEYILIGEDGAPFLDIYKDKAYKIKGKTWVNNHAHILKGKEQFLIDDFALYYLNSINYREYVNGTTRLKLTKSNLVDIPFVIPPLPEQHAIVSKIEELFSELDNGKQQLLTAQQQLKVYRQSLLKWAFEGKLSLNHDSPDLHDGHDLKKEKNQGNHINPKNQGADKSELPEGWKKVKIEDIATVGTGATPLKGNSKYYDKGKIAWVTSGALNEEFVKEATDYVTDLALKETNLSVYPKHTLLLAMYGEGKTRGKCSELLIEAATNQAIAAIHFKNHDERVRPFLKYFLLKNYNDIRRLSSGGVQPNLNLGIVKKTIIPFPTLLEQQLIVSELESKLTVCDKIEETIAQSLQQAETLRQSILKKAFEGKLVAALKKHPTLLEESALCEEAVQAPKGRDTQTMGTAHRNESRVSSKALKGRNNLNLKK